VAGPSQSADEIGGRRREQRLSRAIGNWRDRAAQRTRLSSVVHAYTRAPRGPAASRLAGGCLETVGLLEDVRAVINEEIDRVGDLGRRSSW